MQYMNIIIFTVHKDFSLHIKWIMNTNQYIAVSDKVISDKDGTSTDTSSDPQHEKLTNRNSILYAK